MKWHKNVMNGLAPIGVLDQRVRVRAVFGSATLIPQNCLTGITGLVTRGIRKEVPGRFIRRSQLLIRWIGLLVGCVLFDRLKWGNPDRKGSVCPSMNIRPNIV